MNGKINMNHARDVPIAIALAMWASLFLPRAWAQQAPASAAQGLGAPLEEMIVTDLRIPVPASISATSPTTIVSSQEVQLAGHTDITDVINQLPQYIIGSNVDFGNTSTPLTATGGFTTVDLRGLGPQRTLVLVNGRPLGAGDHSTTNQNDRRRSSHRAPTGRHDRMIPPRSPVTAS
jgi:outer membrane receptor for ferrienterochelin and colicin